MPPQITLTFPFFGERFTFRNIVINKNILIVADVFYFKLKLFPRQPTSNAKGCVRESFWNKKELN